MTPAEFIAKWKDSKLSERAGAQAHFLDLCELLGVEKPSDPENYCFERGAKKTGSLSGKTGWADVWKRHCFAWEYKTPGANLGPPADLQSTDRNTLFVCRFACIHFRNRRLENYPGTLHFFGRSVARGDPQRFQVPLARQC